MTLSICLVSDTHFGRDSLRKEFGDGTHGTASTKLLREFALRNKRTDIIISLGDMIREESRSADAIRLTEMRALLGQKAKLVIGNHDVKFLSDKEIKKCLNISQLYYSFIAQKVQFIVLYSWARKRDGKYGDVLIKQRQVNWLKSTLAKAKLPVIVLNHYPLDEQDLRGNPYSEFFLSHPWRAAVTNRAQVRKVLEKSKNVLAVFNGHLHWQNKTVSRGIPYYTITSLSEMTRGKPRGEWAEVAIRDKKISLAIRRARVR